MKQESPNTALHHALLKVAKERVNDCDLSKIM